MNTQISHKGFQSLHLVVFKFERVPYVGIEYMNRLQIKVELILRYAAYH